MGSVIERNSDFEVELPQDGYTTIDPFTASTSTSVLIILNQKIDVDLEELWRSTNLVICADGGANRLLEYFNSSLEYIPQYIVGDMDSVESKTLEFYGKHGSIIIPQYNQYSTDYMKAVLLAHLCVSEIELADVNHEDGLSLLEKKIVKSIPIHFSVVSSIGGRFDQTIHSINQLYTMKSSFPNSTFTIHTPDDILFLVPNGQNYIKYTKRDNPICGLLPIGQQTILTTLGLKYDVESWPSAMTGNVSSSNTIVGTNGVLVATSEMIVMNIEKKKTRKTGS